MIKYSIFPPFLCKGPLAQSAERGADNAKVESSSLSRTIFRCNFLLPKFLFSMKVQLSAWNPTINLHTLIFKLTWHSYKRWNVKTFGEIKIYLVPDLYRHRDRFSENDTGVPRHFHNSCIAKKADKNSEIQ